MMMLISAKFIDRDKAILSVVDSDWPTPREIKCRGTSVLAVFIGLVQIYNDHPGFVMNISRWLIQRKIDLPLDAGCRYLDKSNPELQYRDKYHDLVKEQVMKYRNLK